MSNLPLNLGYQPAIYTPRKKERPMNGYNQRKNMKLRAKLEMEAREHIAGLKQKEYERKINFINNGGANSGSPSNVTAQRTPEQIAKNKSVNFKKEVAGYTQLLQHYSAKNKGNESAQSTRDMIKFARTPQKSGNFIEFNGDRNNGFRNITENPKYAGARVYKNAKGGVTITQKGADIKKQHGDSSIEALKENSLSTITNLRDKYENGDKTPEDASQLARRIGDEELALNYRQGLVGDQMDKPLFMDSFTGLNSKKTDPGLENTQFNPNIDEPSAYFDNKPVQGENQELNYHTASEEEIDMFEEEKARKEVQFKTSMDHYNNKNDSIREKIKDDLARKNEAYNIEADKRDKLRDVAKQKVIDKKKNAQKPVTVETTDGTPPVKNGNVNSTTASLRDAKTTNIINNVNPGAPTTLQNVQIVQSVPKELQESIAHTLINKGDSKPVQKVKLETREKVRGLDKQLRVVQNSVTNKNYAKSILLGLPGFNPKSESSFVDRDQITELWSKIKDMDFNVDPIEFEKAFEKIDKDVSRGTNLYDYVIPTFDSTLEDIKEDATTLFSTDIENRDLAKIIKESKKIVSSYLDSVTIAKSNMQEKSDKRNKAIVDRADILKRLNI